MRGLVGAACRRPCYELEREIERKDTHDEQKQEWEERRDPRKGSAFFRFFIPFDSAWMAPLRSPGSTDSTKRTNS
jgi:hypothetical protein